ncbi:putative urea active transporter 1 [Taenia solium]|eukprot:TsM_000218200 transcript=TsM_000218200 gene=TsM_000218200
MGEEFVHIRPKPGVLVNVSRRVPSLVEQTCRNLQKSFRDKKRYALLVGDVVKLTCAILLVILVADILTTLCTKKARHARTQSGFTSSSDKPHNLGIVIASFMVQISRPTSILEAVENAESYGIVGCISGPVNGALVYTIFVLLLLEFRTKAPGAQTIAQFVGQRFGVVAHILTITSSLLTGLYALSIDVIVGSKILGSVTKDVSKTAIVSIVFILVGVMVVVARRRSYSVVLYIIITTILLICSFLLLIVLDVPTYTPLGSVDSLYKLLVCYNRSEYGVGGSLIGGFDSKSLGDSLINLIQHVARVMLDQALWETSINLPPNHGVLGLLLAIIMAFCIPFAFGIVCGLGFQALESAFFNAEILNETQKASGLVLYATPIHLLDKGGIWVVFAVILLLLVTSCMFSIVGASSILYHDVLATYIRPFKEQADGKTCLLCGKQRGHLASRRDICRCRSMLECAACHTDTWIKEECRNRPVTTLVYSCQTHGAFRAYTDEMSNSVLQIAFTVMAGMIPIFIIFPDSKVCSHPHLPLT